MKKAKSAVKYGMEVLKLSPDELFKLIESSKDYDGDDNARWLASKIIEVAENDGVQFSQLLVKKFIIINEILEEVSDSSDIKDEVLDIFRSALGKTLYSIDFENIGEPIDVDWYSGLDLDRENSFFVMEKLPEEIKEKIIEDEKLSFILKLSLDSPDKKSDLFSDAKGQGYNLTSKGAMMIYRLCSMVSAFELTNLKVGMLVPVKFLYDVENEPIIEYMLGFFRVSEGYSIRSIEMSLNALNAGDMAFMVLEPRASSNDDQDGILLTSITLDEDDPQGYIELGSKRYSKSYIPMLNKISEESPNLVDDVYSLSAGKLSEKVKGYEAALGYLNINGNISLTTLPENGKTNIPITSDNIKDVIAYYGVTASREIDWGYSSDIPCLIDGRSGYDDLLYNCLPLFLFDVNNKFADVYDSEGNLVTKNNLSVYSDIVGELLDTGIPYFSFEAKELYNLCKDFIDFMKEDSGISGKSFSELRKMGNNSGLNSMYESKLLTLKEYINSLSKGFL